MQRNKEEEQEEQEEEEEEEVWKGSDLVDEFHCFFVKRFVSS